ncbi:MAG: S-layer homology domain-containing protein [Actinobacteria bacterium]|nr:S-layer homology domain-containing protein [Actinomycetota bacterium]
MSFKRRSGIILIAITCLIVIALSIAWGNADILLDKKSTEITTSTIGSTTTTTATTYSYRFVVMGDSRGSTNGVNETQLRNIMGKVKQLSPQPAFILFAGDMVGGGSTVSSQLTYWKDIMDDYYPISSIYPAIGNHEGSEAVFSSAFSHLPNDQVAGYGRTAYHFDYENARFFVLNSNRNHEITSAQRSWLKEMMQDNGKTHNFVMWHEPAYPTGSHVGSSLDVNKYARAAFWDILDNYGGTMGFVGHEHNYTRRHIDSNMNETINGTKFTFERKIYQVTVGSTGAPLLSTYSSTLNVDVPPKAVYHYAVVDVADNLVTVKVYDGKDTLIDSFAPVPAMSNTTTPAPAGFIDIPSDAWYRPYVIELVAKAIISGYPDGTFRPNNPVTRAEFTKMICLAMGWTIENPANPSFSDVSKDSWTFKYIETARAYGITSGYPDGTFRPNIDMTRAEITKFIAEILDLPVGSSTLTDISAHWAQEYINSCVSADVINGYPDGTFRPDSTATRAEATKMITNKNRSSAL